MKKNDRKRKTIRFYKIILLKSIPKDDKGIIEDIIDELLSNTNIYNEIIKQSSYYNHSEIDKMSQYQLKIGSPFK